MANGHYFNNKKYKNHHFIITVHTIATKFGRITHRPCLNLSTLEKLEI